MTDPTPPTPQQPARTPEAGVGAKEIVKILLVILAVAVPVGFRFIGATRKFAEENRGQAERDRIQKKQLDQAVEEMRQSVERGEAGEAVQLLMGVPKDKIKKQKPPKPRTEPTNEEIEAAAAENP